MVRILAARFPDQERASRALEEIQQRLDDDVDAEIAPLAGGDDAAGGDALLAGHFPEAAKPAVEQVVREVGGEIVADVDERWTRPRQPSEHHGQGLSY